jgi:hypothetical protein
VSCSLNVLRVSVLESVLEEFEVGVICESVCSVSECCGGY